MWESVVGPIREHLAAWLLLISCLGAVMTYAARGIGKVVVRRTLLCTLGLCAALSLWMVVAYQPLKLTVDLSQAMTLGPLDRFQFRTSLPWIGGFRPASIERTLADGTSRVVDVSAAWGPGIRLDVGVDGLSLWFVMLSVLLVGLAAATDQGDSGESYGASWLWLLASLVGTFVALDVVLLSVCWLSTWLAVAWLLRHGGEVDRREVTFRLVKTAWIGSWLTALGLCGLVLIFGWLRQTPMRPQPPLLFAIPELLHGLKQMSSGEHLLFWRTVSPWMFWLLLIGFTWPLMLAPFHRVLLAGLSSAPTGLAMVLAGVAIKVGLYGWLRFLVPLFGDLLEHLELLLATAVSVFSLFAAVLALGQADWRSRVALATASSLGLCVLGIVTMTLQGLTSGLLRGLSHGLSIPLLIWLCGRDLAPRFQLEAQRSNNGSVSESKNAFDAGSQVSEPQAGSLGRRSLCFRLAIAGVIGMPGFGGFVSDVLLPLGLFQQEFNLGLISLATSGLLAWMWVRAERDAPVMSVAWSGRDWLVVGVLLSANATLGLFPQFVIDRVQPTLVQSLPAGDKAETESSGQEP